MKTEIEYYLCSEEVVKHFPDLKKSLPFKSGYEWDKNNYFIIETTDFAPVNKYFNEVIAPYNEKSNCPLDFWLRQVCPSQLDAGVITLKQCRQFGIFQAIENELDLTNGTNRAFAIFSLSKKFNCKNPIEFIRKVCK
jgi:hypothetical protein